VVQANIKRESPLSRVPHSHPGPRDVLWQEDTFIRLKLQGLQFSCNLLLRNLITNNLEKSAEHVVVFFLSLVLWWFRKTKRRIKPKDFFNKRQQGEHLPCRIRRKREQLQSITVESINYFNNSARIEREVR